MVASQKVSLIFLLSVFIPNFAKFSEDRYEIDSCECDEEVVGECDIGWQLFNRKAGPVCLNVFLHGPMIHEEAEKSCKSMLSELSGLENKNESSWIHEQALPHLPQKANQQRWLWIGGKRRTECLRPPYDASCFPKETEMFEWTDPTVTGKAGMGPWWVADPDNYRNSQACLVFTVQNFAVSANKYNTTPGSLDDTQCNFINGIIGYVCSKPAKL